MALAGSSLPPRVVVTFGWPPRVQWFRRSRPSDRLEFALNFDVSQAVNGFRRVGEAAERGFGRQVQSEAEHRLIVRLGERLGLDPYAMNRIITEAKAGNDNRLFRLIGPKQPDESIVQAIERFLRA